MPTTKAPEAPTTLAPAASFELGVEVELTVWLAVCTACTPNVVPVTTCPLMVVVTVAGCGVAVVVLHPLQMPDQVDCGPQPPVHVDHAQFGPPHGPLLFHPMPGPPHVPEVQLPGGPGSAVEHADNHELQPLEPGPQGPGPPKAPDVMVGQAEPPDVALKVASGVAVTVLPALAQTWAMAA